MKITLHMCMPEGDGSREGYNDALRMIKRDNQRVIAAMMHAGDHVPDTVGEIGLQYVPAPRRNDPVTGKPLMDVYGFYDMVQRGVFSCGDAAAYESAVFEEKYGIRTEPLSVPQGDNDFHGIFVTADGVVDPTENFLRGRRPKLPRPLEQPMSDCWIEDGRVRCNEPASCAIDERGVWHCPVVPGLTGRREPIGNVQVSSRGQAWARTRKTNAAVPVRRSR
jgi:hypothetical protein